MKTKKLREGDVIYADNGIYQHYGIYNGNGTVIDRTGNGVSERSLTEFCNGLPLYVDDSYPEHSRKRAMKKARSRVGESGYDLLNNNCEHFARGCYGERKSRQVDNAVEEVGDFLEGVGTVVLAPVIIGVALVEALFG